MVGLIDVKWKGSASGGGRMYWIVTGMTLDVGMLSTYLVGQCRSDDTGHRSVNKGMEVNTNTHAHWFYANNRLITNDLFCWFWIYCQYFIAY